MKLNNDIRILRTDRLLTPGLNLLLQEKIKTFHQKRLNTANLDDLVREWTMYRLEETSENCGGFVDHWDETIALNPQCETHTRQILCHEVAHVLQRQTEADYMHVTRHSLYHTAVHEQQAEAVAYRLFTGCFEKTAPLSDFDNCFSRKDLLFVLNWYTALDYELDDDGLL